MTYSSLLQVCNPWQRRGWIRSLKIVAFAFFIFWTTLSYGQVTGGVWQDLNADGQRDALEPSVEQIVRAYDGLGKLLAETRTDANGYYTLNIAHGKRVRLEFGTLPKGMYPVLGHSTVQFVTSPAEAMMPVYYPGQFTGIGARAFQSVYGVGGMGNKGLSTIASLVSYPAQATDSISYTPITYFPETGSIWGLAFDRQRQLLFSSAIAKRHSALGKLGCGGIYVTNPSTGETKTFISLDSLGYSTGQNTLRRDLTDDWAKPSHDSLMFSQVGKIGLGGLDISDDGRFLYVMNLYDRHLYRIKLPTSVMTGNQLLRGETPGEVKQNDITRFPIPVISQKGGETRPFAVKYYNGMIYVGLVLDAQISQKAEDLQGYVLAMDADETDAQHSRFIEIAHFPLNYQRGKIGYGVKGWFPWTDNYLKTLVPNQSGWMIYPQPMLADIEFDSDGSLIVSLMDRLGHQTGDGQLYRPNATGSFLTARGLSGGDILRFEKTKKSYLAEKNGQVGARISAGRSNGEGPGGGEFYLHDSFTASGTTWHHETAMGGLAMLPDDNSLLVSVREPDQYVTGGVKWFSNETGQVRHAMSVFPGGMKPGYFWKPNNVGDIEIAASIPSTGILSRVWLDNDGDGLQGADEPGLPDVTLELYRDNELVGTTISDSEGTYRFDDDNVKEKVRSRTPYEVRIPLKQSIGNLTLTKMGGRTKFIDNDALANPAGYAVMKFSTTNPGEHILHLDAGFLCSNKPLVAAKLNCIDNQLQVILLGYKEDQKYDLTLGEHYDGVALYAAANRIEQNGLIAKTSLTEGKPYEATLRVYEPSGCYTDTFISTLNEPGCAFVPENLLLKTPYSIAVYPNPSTGPIQIAYRSGVSDGTIHIQITDINGRVIENRSEQLSNGHYQGSADIARQSPGTYVITVKDGSRHTTKSILKP